ncbi:thiamine phosphate synthase [Rhodoferax antarcticus]|uniref:thiamine phosphate synthase n=1 Tax=Rhodoferax antarcticus TaxID=81479 RepID=UPI002224C179|nr:thiamine phosphate synthase [Rhodoferax antarcticus]MCW2312973.1 thiamine-phosphate pyrophosphorylase [Rhodoferax antarcticus]
MNIVTDLASRAQAIVSAHTALALESHQDYELFRPLALIDKAPVAIETETADDIYQAAKMACLALDFIDADADCIAQAWQAQSLRTGYFDAQTWPTEPQDFGLRPLPRTDAFAICPHQLGLYAVLPDAAWVGRMARAGVPTVQLRFKSDDAHAIVQEVRAAVEAVRGTDALLFINDHWQTAIDAGAYGVHLGQEDLDSADLDAIRAAGLRLGLSSHGYAEMLRADHLSPSYIAMGAVFATTLKRMVTPPQGLARLKVYAQLLRNYSTVAIGGIDLARMPEVLARGVGSVGVVRALVAAAQPQLATAEFLDAFAAQVMAKACDSFPT